VHRDEGTRVSRLIGLLPVAGCLVLLGASSAAARGDARVEASYTVNPQRVLNHIDEKVYGHFFEHIYHSANGGLWGELVWNGSVEENSGSRWGIDNETWGMGIDGYIATVTIGL
jgi:hypothetical protein